MKRTVKSLEQYLNWLTRSKSPVFYRFYRHHQKKQLYLACWVYWGNQGNWFTGTYDRRGEVRILKLLNRDGAVLIDTDFLPRDLEGKFENIEYIEIRPMKITLGPDAGETKHVVVTRFKDGSRSFPHSNVFDTEREARERAWDLVHAVMPIHWPPVCYWGFPYTGPSPEENQEKPNVPSV